jgi:sporulation protein YabP
MADHLNTENKKHTLSLGQRTQLQITGVSDVQSFDEQSVVLMTDCGELTVEGEGLHVSTLDIASGRVDVAGRISALCYGDAQPARRGLRAKLFG